MRSGLFVEIVAMAVATLRTQKMRSALTILGIAIGITSRVSMTSLIRGFTESLNDQIRQIGPDTIMVAQFSGISMMQGADFMELLQRPTLTVDDAEAIERQASESIASVNIQLGGMPGPGPAPTRCCSTSRTRLHPSASPWRANRSQLRSRPAASARPSWWCG